MAFAYLEAEGKHKRKGSHQNELVDKLWKFTTKKKIFYQVVTECGHAIKPYSQDAPASISINPTL